MEIKNFTKGEAMRNYIVLKCNDEAALVDKINEKIQEGYIPVGGMTESRRNSNKLPRDKFSDEIIIFSQTLYKPLEKVNQEYTLQKKDRGSVKYNLSNPETWRDMPKEDFDALMKEGVNVGGLNFKEKTNASKKN